MSNASNISWLKRAEKDQRIKFQKWWNDLTPERKRMVKRPKLFSIRMNKKLENHIKACKDCNSQMVPCKKAANYGTIVAGHGRVFNGQAIRIGMYRASLMHTELTHVKKLDTVL